MSDLYYTQSIAINADPSKVWDALINPALTQQYMFGCEAISDWKIGSPLIWRGAADGVDYVTGHVVSFEPEHVLAFTVFDPNGTYKDVPENYLTTTYTLSSNNSQTTLHVSQGNYSTAEDGQKRFEDSAGGWDMTLQALKKLVEA